MADRVILHCDLNSFYASVELLFHPEFKTVPMAVCGDLHSRHGIILAKNDAAKAYHVQTAETVYHARKKCPGLVLLPPHHDEYVRYSHLVNQIYLDYTDLVEPFGIDESWLDVSGSLPLFGSGREIAEQIRQRVQRELGLTISVGISFNKVFAKLGSDYRKPNAITEIPRNGFMNLIGPLPVSSLLYVGAVTARHLEQVGIRTIRQLAETTPDLLKRLLGKKGISLWEYANGLDNSPVAPYNQKKPVKSIGNGMTFPKDLTTEADLCSAISLLCDQVGFRIRHHNMLCCGIQLRLKDPDFHVKERQVQFSKPTNSTRILFDQSVSLLSRFWREGYAVRAVTVTAIHLIPASSGTQTDLFSDASQIRRQMALEASVDRLRERYGQAILSTASVLQARGLFSEAAADNQEESELSGEKETVSSK